MKVQGADGVTGCGAQKLSLFIKYFRTTDSKLTKQTENAARIGDVKMLYKILLGKSERTYHL